MMKQTLTEKQFYLYGFPLVLLQKFIFADPPGKAPVISTQPSLNPSQPVYKGDNFTLTCTVHGGKPVNATRVTFACPHMIDMGDIIGTTEVNSSLTFFSVSSDNQGNCSCSAMWKNTTWYTQTAEWTLIVYSEYTKCINMFGSIYVFRVRRLCSSTCV